MFYTNCITGWAAFIISIFVCSYSLFKRTSLKSRLTPVRRRRFLGCHCLLAFISTIAAIIHTGKNILEPELSIPFFCLYGMILASITGIIMKYAGIKSGRSRKGLLFTHVASTLLFLSAFLVHLLINLFDLHP